MPHYGTRSSSSAELSDDEWRAVCAYADEEIRRIRPRNTAAYRATVVARKMDEIVQLRGVMVEMDEFHTTRRVIDTAPVDDFIAPVDPLLARQIWRQELAAVRAEREALLSSMEAEQGRNHSWG